MDSFGVFQQPASPTASQSNSVIGAATGASRQGSRQGGGDFAFERCYRIGDVPFWPERHVPLACNLREEKLFCLSRRNGILRGNRLPFGDQKGVSSDAQRGVVVEAAPSSALIVAESYFLFQIEVIALNAPAQFGYVHKRSKIDVPGES